MAQAEDTELRDLVIEALERNGSLAKIRALLRANIFLAFEDECENLKQNVNLDNILKLPEGLLALSVVHEFLEFCCLKNTLFVYMSESRQGNAYNYEGKKILSEKISFAQSANNTEPLLVTLIKNMTKQKYFNSSDTNYNSHDKCDDKNYRDEENCTYILHEDSQSSNTSNSHSDNSSDEKNKLHLRLQLDNSDTDTSSDSARDKTSSEYIPGDHILPVKNNDMKTNYTSPKSSGREDARVQNKICHERSGKETSLIMSELKLGTNSSISDSTSYIELKPFNSLDEKMLNTAGLPIMETDSKDHTDGNMLSITNIKNELTVVQSPHSINKPVTTTSMDNENKSVDVVNEKNSQLSGKSDGDTAEFSYGDDFSSSPASKVKEIDKHKSPESVQDELDKSFNKNSSVESAHQSSQSSQSSVSISDVADLISEKSSLSTNNKKSKVVGNVSRDNTDSKLKDISKLNSDDSADFTESPVPSLSNLSLDIHSD